MHEIMCPHCHKAFKIDEAGYADILKQVRDGAFEQALHERLELAEREKRDAIALAKAEVTNTLQKAAAAKDTEIQALKAQLDAGEVARKLAVTEALGTVSQERDALANQLKNELAQARSAQQPHDGGPVCGVAGASCGLMLKPVASTCPAAFALRPPAAGLQLCG